MQLYKLIRYQIWAIIWAILVVVLCNIRMSGNKTESLFLFEGFDKLAHLGFFFVLTILLFYGKIRHQHNYGFRFLTILKIILITASLGGLIELVQWTVFTYRSAEWWDFICDMIGVGMGIFSYIALHRSNYNEKKA